MSERIGVFGMGYVGVTTAGCLADLGHRVVGVDVVEAKLELLRKGRSPIVEEAISEIIERVVDDGRLTVTDDAGRAVAETDICFVCVGTPSRQDGSLETRYVEQVTRQIGDALRSKDGHTLVVVRSTLLPGTTRNLVLPVLEEATGEAPGDRYDVVFHPEFLREGSSVHDFYHPPKIVVGEVRPGGAERLLGLYPEDTFDAPRLVCPLEVAEMAKYSDNIFHALKITFANEIGQICHALDIDSNEVIDIFLRDTKLNISEKYLRPGFAFGGSCLPKDLRAVLSLSRDRNVTIPVLEHILVSNRHQVERAVGLALSSGCSRIGMYGLAFKPGTDDLRESPYVELAERLLGKGCTLAIYDENVQSSRLMGENKAYVDRHLPHLADLLVPDVDALEHSELIVIGHGPDDEVVERWKRQGKKLLDLTGMLERDDESGVLTVT